VFCRNQVENLTVDCSLIFTRYLDAAFFNENDLQRILERYLMNGRLGQFTLGRSSYIYRDASDESGKFRNDDNKLIMMASLSYPARPANAFFSIYYYLFSFFS